MSQTGIELCTILQATVESEFEVWPARDPKQIELRHKTTLKLTYFRDGKLVKDDINPPLFGSFTLTIEDSKIPVFTIPGILLKIQLSASVDPRDTGLFNILITFKNLVPNSPFCQLALDNPEKVDFHEKYDPDIYMVVQYQTQESV